MKTLGDMKIGTIVKLEVRVTGQPYSNFTRIAIDDGLPLDLNSSTPVVEFREPLERGDRVLKERTSTVYRVGYGNTPTSVQGTVEHVSDGRAWVNWDSGAPTLVKVENLTKVPVPYE